MTIEQLSLAGGKRWQKGDMDRIYFDNLPTWYGLKANFYRSGNVNGATLDGTGISNTWAREILSDLEAAKFWFDVPTSQFMGRGFPRGEDYFKVIVARVKEQATLIKVA